MKFSSIFRLRKWVGLFLNTKFGKRLDDRTFIKLEYYSNFGKRLNLNNPVTFNEKLQWLKLYDRNPMYTRMVDKVSAKEYVAEIIGEQYIIPTLGVWDRPEDINFDALPNQFVLKVTHDSGGLVICRDKSKFDKSKAIDKLTRSLKRDYYSAYREWPYKDVRKRILAEEYLEDNMDIESKGLVDYKFFCFNGVPRMLYISQGLENHETAEISFFDFEGKQLPFHRKDYKPFIENKELPACFEKMIDISGKIARNVNNPFIRIDLYAVQEQIYFSEITFYPCSGMIPFDPPEWDKKIGGWINLPSDEIG